MRDDLSRAVARVLIAAFAAMALIAGAACNVRRAHNNHIEQQILQTSLPSDPQTFNPILITDNVSGHVLDEVFDPLVQINNETTLPEPGLAESWDIAPDQKSVTFHLRPGTRWFDGQPVTAHDVLFTLQVIFDPKVPNSLRFGLQIDGKPIVADAPDDHTVVMHLPRPFAPLLYSAVIPIVPAHILEPIWKAGNFNHAWGINTPPGQIVGDGAYEMTQYVQGQFVRFARNEDYWMKDEHGGQLPRLHGLVMQVISDANATYLRYLYGQLDVYAPRAEEVHDVKQRIKDLRLHAQLKFIGIDTGERFFCFNRNPRRFVKNGVTEPKLTWFTDLNFLTAIAHLIDKEAMIDLVAHGLAVPSVSDMSPENKLFYNPNLKDFDYDPREAERIFESAGYHVVDGRRVDPKNHPIEFNLMTGTGSPEADQICAIFKQDLENEGIKVNYQPVEFSTLVEKIDTSFDWDCVMMGLTGSIEPNDGSNFYLSSGDMHLWDPDQSKPATQWEAEIDRLVAEGAAEMDQQKRVPYYWRIQQILHDQLAVIQTVRSKDFLTWTDALQDYQRTVWGPYKPEWMYFNIK